MQVKIQNIMQKIHKSINCGVYYGVLLLNATDYGKCVVWIHIIKGELS